MKIRKILFALFMILTIVFNCSVFSTISTFAHDEILDVDYDTCVADDSDGINETWYTIYNSSNATIHLNDAITTIRYYFAETSEEGDYTWASSGMSESEIETFKEAYANSMKKWNNVYFYSYDENGALTKHKIINVEEGSAYNHNLTIYPYAHSTGSDIAYASTNIAVPYDRIEPDIYPHAHCDEWKMYVYLEQFINSDNIDELFEREGAHELGHVLGLLDVDRYCGSNTSTDHHHGEVLMGYGNYEREVDITYKDIAGVAITRGLHTDDDHKWINFGQQNDGTYKLVCSICNGVKKVSSLSGYTYVTYGACNNNHYLYAGNMMAVASYGTKDYYKCKYCRYVAPFYDIVNQNYTRTYYSDLLHKCSNTVTGLQYFYYENHTFVNNVCTGCGFVHTHSYSGLYLYHNNYYHSRSCSCGQLDLQAHSVMRDEIVDNKARCLGCRRMLDLTEDFANSILSIITQVSVNGSYVLPSGIVVLVDEDVQAYSDGTLVFYHPDDIPTTQ